MDPRQIIVASEEPPLRVIGWMDEEPPRITDGLGGWVEVARARRKPISDFQGLSALRMVVPLVLDGFATNTSQEPFIRNVIRMGRLEGSRKTTSIVRFSGRGFVGGLDWVIESIEFGASLFHEEGYRLRQHVTFNVMEYVSDQHLAALAKRNQRRGATPTNKRYVVKAGEHLGEIAAKQLGNAQRWREIAQLNNIRDPQSVKKGQTLRMPAR